MNNENVPSIFALHFFQKYVPSWVVEWAPQILEWACNFLCNVYAMKTEILKMINVFENALVANQRSFCYRWIE